MGRRAVKLGSPGVAVALIVTGCFAGGDSAIDRVDSDQSPAACEYTAYRVPRDVSPERLERLGRRQPDALALNEDGAAVCAYVHDDQLLYWRGSDEELSIVGNNRIELRFEAPVTEIEPYFPDVEGCAVSDIDRVDESTWSFRVPDAVLSGECPASPFSVDVRYERGSRFAEKGPSYGVTLVP